MRRRRGRELKIGLNWSSQRLNLDRRSMNVKERQAGLNEALDDLRKPTKIKIDQAWWRELMKFDGFDSSNSF